MIDGTYGDVAFEDRFCFVGEALAGLAAGGVAGDGVGDCGVGGGHTCLLFVCLFVCLFACLLVYLFVEVFGVDSLGLVVVWCLFICFFLGGVIWRRGGGDVREGE